MKSSQKLERQALFMNKYPLIIIVTVLVFAVCGCTTNSARHQPSCFLTEVEAAPYPNPLTFAPEQIEKALRAHDSRPAKDAPEGNWGSAVEGFQLSLRLDKKSFTNGEPITACVILRNVSGTTRGYPYEFTPDEREITFVLLRGEDRILGKYDIKPDATFVEKLRAIRTGHGWVRESPPGTQHKTLVNLSSYFQLTNSGDYVVQAKREIVPGQLAGATSVASGKVFFQIRD